MQRRDGDLSTKSQKQKCRIAIWYLYVIEFPNGKKYFGVSRNVGRRFEAHLHGKEGQKSQVTLALRAYPEAQIRTLVCGYKTYIFALEAECIEQFETYRFERGYNIARGGAVRHLEWHAPQKETRHHQGARSRSKQRENRKLRRLSHAKVVFYQRSVPS